MMDLGIKDICRETLLSSIALGESVLDKLGFDTDEVEHIGRTFRERDAQLLAEQYAIHDSEDKLIQSAKDTARELESTLSNDRRR